MSTVVVSSYPPRHCGIGAYAHTQVQRLRSEGQEVVVISPPDGAGDLRLRFTGGRPFLAAARLGRAADEIVVHFQTLLYFRPRAPVSKVATALGLLWLVLRRPRTRILVHEFDPPRPRWRPDYVLLGWAFRRARLRFHTEAERRALERAYGIRTRAELVPHVEGVTIHGPSTREAARARLGIDPGERLLVCAGFVAPGKGFDDAIRAFTGDRGRASEGARLVIVGSVRDRTPENLEALRELRRLADASPGVEFLDSYVSDEEFDAWVAAADALVLPYRVSWSSGALARAQALGTPAIVSDVGGLPEQAGPRDRVVHGARQLAEAMEEVARASGSRSRTVEAP